MVPVKLSGLALLYYWLTGAFSCLSLFGVLPAAHTTINTPQSEMAIETTVEEADDGSVDMYIDNEEGGYEVEPFGVVDRGMTLEQLAAEQKAGFQSKHAWKELPDNNHSYQSQSNYWCGCRSRVG